MVDSSEIQNSLRVWQREALSVWEQAGRRGIIEVVTGGGKTRFALAAATRWKQSQQKDSAVLIIVPTSALQDQWYVNLTNDLGILKNQISVWPEERDTSREFHVMVVNTARQCAERIASNHSSTLLIADECHRYASLENSAALEQQFTSTLGLTATAEREYDDGLERVLIPHLGSIIYRYSLAQARRDEVVSDFMLTNVQVWFSDEEQRKFDRLSRSLSVALRQEDTEAAKGIAMRRAAVSKGAVSRVTGTVRLMEELRGRRTIIFHEEIKTANSIAQLLRRRAHRTVVFHSQVSRDMRRDNLRQFKSSQADVLVCCRALDEGIDVPEAECAIIAASTSSQRQRVQRLGRILRLHNEKKLAQVYSFYVTDSEQRKLSEEVRNLEGITMVRWLEMKRA
jgi:superfamily II DNA or RNA helicase